MDRHTALGRENNLCVRVAVCLLLSLSASGLAHAGDATSADVIQLQKSFEEQGKRLDDQQSILEEQAKNLQMQRRQLNEQKRQLETLGNRMGVGQPSSAAEESDQTPTADHSPSPPLASPVSQSDQGEPSAEKSLSPVGIAPENPQPLPPTIVRIFDLPGSGVLTPKGTLVLEPYLQYAHLTNNRGTLVGFTIVPALTIGLIDVRSINRNIYTAAMVGRYGLTNRIELEVRVPYIYRTDSTTMRPLATPSVTENVFNAESYGLGDIEVTGRYQINKGGVDKPYFVGFSRFKTTTGKGPFEVSVDPVTNLQTELPTGSGFYILQPGLAVLYPTDPAVLFGSISYLWNIPRNVGGELGRVDPGSGGNMNFGLGLSLNEKLSMSLGYDHTVFANPTASGNVLLTTAATTTHIGVLSVGAAYRLSEKTFLNVVIGAGVTREAPDVQVTFRMPTAFLLGQ